MKQYKPVVIVLFAAVTFYIIHKLGIYFFENLRIANSIFSIDEMYVYFTSLSLFIVLILVKVSRKSFDNVGMVFMIATSAKMLICYFLFKPIFNSAIENNQTERICFFVMFILFLAIETVITVRILNNKQ